MERRNVGDLWVMLVSGVVFAALGWLVLAADAAAYGLIAVGLLGVGGLLTFIAAVGLGVMMGMNRANR